MCVCVSLILIVTVATQSYIPITGAQKSPFPHILANTCSPKTEHRQKELRTLPCECCHSLLLLDTETGVKDAVACQGRTVGKCEVRTSTLLVWAHCPPSGPPGEAASIAIASASIHHSGKNTERKPTPGLLDLFPCT